jgi:hypothetical protein
VVFDSGEDGVVIVEVKDGIHDGELVRGVDQAVKYRSLMVAEKGQGEAYSVRTFLAAQKKRCPTT